MIQYQERMKAPLLPQCIIDSCFYSVAKLSVPCARSTDNRFAGYWFSMKLDDKGSAHWRKSLNPSMRNVRVRTEYDP